MLFVFVSVTASVNRRHFIHCRGRVGQRLIFAYLECCCSRLMVVNRRHYWVNTPTYQCDTIGWEDSAAVATSCASVYLALHSFSQLSFVQTALDHALAHPQLHELHLSLHHIDTIDCCVYLVLDVACSSQEVNGRAFER